MHTWNRRGLAVPADTSACDAFASLAFACNPGAQVFFSQVWVTKLMNLPARLRFQLFQSSILSTPYFAGESWHTPAGRQLGCLRKALHRMVSKL